MDDDDHIFTAVKADSSSEEIDVNIFDLLQFIVKFDFAHFLIFVYDFYF